MAKRINSCQEYFETLGERFVAEKSKGVNATYQFELSGDGGGTWAVKVADGGIEVIEGGVDEPDSVVTAKADNYIKIANGDINGLRAVMTRKMKVKGNLVLARKMQHMFPTGNI